MPKANKYPKVNLYYQGVLLFSMDSRGTTPWENLKKSPTLRKQLTDNLILLGMDSDEVQQVLRLHPSGSHPNYVRERARGV